MDDDNLLIICRSCGRKVLMHNMRPDKDGEHMICVDCIAKTAGTKSTSLFSKAVEAVRPKPKTETAVKMVKYICTKCKYKFSRKLGQEVTKCPYCGKNSIVVDSQLGADKLINDSMDKRFESW